MEKTGNLTIVLYAINWVEGKPHVLPPLSLIKLGAASFLSNVLFWITLPLEGGSDEITEINEPFDDVLIC